MSAETSARTVSATEQVDKVRALQRVLYRSAKQEPHRRFHALYDKVVRSDILWRAWAVTPRLTRAMTDLQCVRNAVATWT